MALKLLLIDEEAPLETSFNDDDVSPYMWYYLNALRQSGIDFQAVTSVDDAMQILASEPASFNAVSIDVIMPPGNHFSEAETAYGSRTGIRFLQWLIDKGLNPAIVIFSNVPERIVRAALPSQVSRLTTLVVEEKPKRLPYSFADIIKRLEAT